MTADAYLRQCASRTVLTALADKWTCLLVDALKAGPVRFGVLRRKLDGITQKSLTQALRTMERNGIVIRTHYPSIPPRATPISCGLKRRERFRLVRMDDPNVIAISAAVPPVPSRWLGRLPSTAVSAHRTYLPTGRESG